MAGLEYEIFTHCLTIIILFSPIFAAKDVGKTANETLAFKRFVTLYTLAAETIRLHRNAVIADFLPAEI